MANKNIRDKRIFDLLEIYSYKWMTCEEIFRELCRKSNKNGVKSIKALSKILPRFPLMKDKKMIVARDSMGIELCNYITVYKLDPNYETTMNRGFII